MSNRHMQRYTSLMIRDVQIKTTKSYHLISVMAIKRPQIIYVGEDVWKRELAYTVGRNISWYSPYGK